MGQARREIRYSYHSCKLLNYVPRTLLRNIMSRQKLLQMINLNLVQVPPQCPCPNASSYSTSAGSRVHQRTDLRGMRCTGRRLESHPAAQLPSSARRGILAPLDGTRPQHLLHPYE